MHNGREIARAGLLEITPASTIGDAAGEIDEGDGVISYQFETLMDGYPGWKWTVSVAQVDDSEPTVLETELIPAEGALLAPEWVPWSDRMDDYRAAQIALGEVVEDDESDDDSDDDDSEDDDDESDESDESDDDSDDDDSEDDDDDVRPVLHAGDLDGVDIDEIDVSALGADSDDDSDSDDDDSEADDTDDDFADEDAAVQAGAFGNPADQIFKVVEFDLVDVAPESEETAPEASDAHVDVAGEDVDVPAVAPVTKRPSRRATSASVLPAAE